MSKLFDFPESAKVHEWLDQIDQNKIGIEIGGSAHNHFGLKNCLNLDYTSDMDTIFKQEEIRLCGQARPVDIVAFADEIPSETSSYGYLLNSHVFEHQPNPLRTLKEWHRVVEPGGLIISIIPKRDALPQDACLPVATIDHQVVDYINNSNHDSHEILPGHSRYGHYHIYSYESYFMLVDKFNEIFGKSLEIIDSLETDDKVGNGSLFVHRVLK